MIDGKDWFERDDLKSIVRNKRWKVIPMQNKSIQLGD